MDRIRRPGAGVWLCSSGGGGRLGLLRFGLGRGPLALDAAPAPSLAGSPQTVQVKSYLGSEVQQPPYVLAQRCAGGEQLARVLVKRNFWQGFVSWVSLGLIAPATVVYTCANAGDPPLGGGGR